MNRALTANTQAILLLTAPLIVGRSKPSPGVLKPREYNRLARLLRENGHQPADLLASDGSALANCQSAFDTARLARLLERGFMLSQALEHWRARTIWVLSRADGEYPKRLKQRLGADAPTILYGCGEIGILDSGGLAVVGSRKVENDLVEYTQAVGRLTARANRTVVSGGARGVDQAAMRGALEAGGTAIGVLADSLERTALRHEHRAVLMDGQLVLVSPYDPSAGFNVGNAMRRNKIIYALADAALVVSSAVGSGGTWAGAKEQLDSLRLVPVYVRSMGGHRGGLNALRKRGATEWPEPDTPEALVETLHSAVSQTQLPLAPIKKRDVPVAAEQLYEKVKELARALVPTEDFWSEDQIAGGLGVRRSQTRDWLHRLVEDGVIEKHERPVRYRLARPFLLDQ